MSTVLFILLLAVFFILSAFTSLSETAIFASNRYKIRHLASEGNRRAAKLSEWLESPERLLATILLLNNSSNVRSCDGLRRPRRWTGRPGPSKHLARYRDGSSHHHHTSVLRTGTQGDCGQERRTDQPARGHSDRDPHAACFPRHGLQHPLCGSLLQRRAGEAGNDSTSLVGAGAEVDHQRVQAGPGQDARTGPGVFRATGEGCYGASDRGHHARDQYAVRRDRAYRGGHAVFALSGSTRACSTTWSASSTART